MAQNAPIESLELRPITPADFPKVYKFVKEHFLENEPIHTYLYKKLSPDFRYLDRTANILASIQEGTSFMFVTPSGEIAAFALTADAKSYKPNPPEHSSPIYLTVKKVIEAAIEGCSKIFELEENDKEMCFRMLGTHPSWTNRGLAKILAEKTIATAKDRGFTIIRAYCTSAFSAKLFAKCGFECIYKLSYEDYKKDGEVVLKLAAPHTHLQIMVLRILRE